MGVVVLLNFAQDSDVSATERNACLHRPRQPGVRSPLPSSERKNSCLSKAQPRRTAV